MLFKSKWAWWRSYKGDSDDFVVDARSVMMLETRFESPAKMIPTFTQSAKLLIRLESLLESKSSCELAGRLHKLVAKLNNSFGGCGSLFRFFEEKKLLNSFDDPIKAFNISSRSGTELSFFGANASIWPDLYSGCVANLGREFLPELRDSANRPSSSGEYKLDHVFIPPHSRMPHEVTSEEVSFARLSV